MTWKELAERIRNIPSTDHGRDAMVNLSKEPDRLTDIGPIGDLRCIKGEWVMELEDDSE